MGTDSADTDRTNVEPVEPISRSVCRVTAMLALVIAGEAVFFLPFVVARVFRPTLLDVFGLSNLELGIVFSVYGLVAMLAYFPGGPLADRFSARRLMAIALVATSAGGLVMATIPNFTSLKWLYGYWGLTTVLLFWSALIRATRQWGGHNLQGRAFGLLDGGRGLVAAGVGSLAVLAYSAALPDDVTTATLVERSDAFRNVILIFAGITLVAAAFVWWALPASSVVRKTSPGLIGLEGVRYVIAMPAIWLQAVIVVAAYVGYKGLDDVSLYAKEALGFNEVDAAKISTLSMWVRPFAAVGAGLIADRVGIARTTAASFFVLMIGSGLIASGALRAGMLVPFLLTIVATSAAIFAFRGLYFAIMEDGKVPFRYTGSAVGLVSVIGYTPDLFMGPLMGWLIDRSPGALGHQHVFAVIAGFALLGFVAAIGFPFAARWGRIGAALPLPPVQNPD